MNAREAILARLPGGFSGAAAAEAEALLVATERPFVDAAALEAGFLAQIAQPGVAATVARIASLDDLPGTVRAYLRSSGLPAALYVPPDARIAAGAWPEIELRDTIAQDGDAALAFARCGVAETGSLIFETGAEAPMLPSFLALHHIVVVPRLVAHLEDALLAGAQPRAHYWVTGVSGTTDIEGAYVRGAHGPRFLHVILLSPVTPAPAQAGDMQP